MKMKFIKDYRGAKAGGTCEVFAEDSIANALRLAEDGIVEIEGHVTAAAKKKKALSRAKSKTKSEQEAAAQQAKQEAAAKLKAEQEAEKAAIEATFTPPSE